LRESSLHYGLKQFYTQDGGITEVWIDGYLIDVVKNKQLIEIQTGNFNAIKTKLENLINAYEVRVVFPIAREKFLILRDSQSAFISKRRSPKKGRIEDVFNQLVFLSHLASHPNFSLEVLFTSEEEYRVKDGLGSWRRRGISITDRRLLSILGRIVLAQKADFSHLVPGSLMHAFTNIELAQELDISKRLAGKMTYCLTNMGILERSGKRGKAFLFRRPDMSPDYEG
jgi:hypothetical protein